MAEEQCKMTALPSSADTLHQLMRILGHDFRADMSSLVSSLSSRSSIQIKFNAEICIEPQISGDTEDVQAPPVHMGSITVNVGELRNDITTNQSCNVVSPMPARGSVDRDNLTTPSTALSQPSRSDTSPVAFDTLSNDFHSSSHSRKRRKTAGALRVTEHQEPFTPAGSSTARQLQTKPRDFPQRKKKNEDGIHLLQPSSVERFIAGIWKQVFSSVEITPMSLGDVSSINSVGSGGSIETFRKINSLCLRITKMTKSSRALETIIQAHWVDCFEARIKNIGFEKPFLSGTETKMSALREACGILNWSEKELRNRLSIWRGYKEIKDVGGWVCLVFAGSGIYRFCKYRGGFGKNLATRLDKLRPSLEVAADTLHPEWRELLAVIGQDSQRLYPGHPHDWVVCDGMAPATLKSTYTQWNPNFKFTHIETSVLDQTLWSREDPRRIAGTKAVFCSDCGYFQSENISANECKCFPELYGACRAPVPVQVFRTPIGKNNGLIARCEFSRGSAIGEFTGLITKGMDGIDVMQSGHDEKRYQIYQGTMGNYTRFINHSCAPNSQFQKFCWLGSERIILVSRGVEAGAEITVDYSHEYWEGLDKTCLCGEPCCRYSRR
ncbi:related to THI3-positive regulation factor of thiamin metabolism [Rhynchosporium agropyri]|uniref:Related to THI3-positive regulation factor of thiamin metabolism n=1 Tax=Rhynchosporium agropyri TaxID=914238 RepID=A0A1E1LCD1_9HELO|nr:related to THI3-positive regulation factor of thiamin metabolism [Rhynchosporium agropyri]